MGDHHPERDPNTANDSGVGPQPTEFPVVGIGASAGGLDAASRLLNRLPGELGVAFVVVQHLDPTHESSLSELLARICRMPVCEAEEGVPLEPDHVYVIPPNSGMVLRRGSLHLTPRDRTSNPHRPVDLFLTSLAEERRGQSIGVVLSGTGSDGTFGLESIRVEGGVTFAQDSTAAYAGMPTSAVDAGCVDYVLPPERIAEELIRIGRHLSVQDTASRTAGPAAAKRSETTLDAVVTRLGEASGVDFSNYKQATVQRRIHRRMVICRADTIEQYLTRLDADPGEIEALRREVLINVTSFFRDPDVFDTLKELVFPAILEERPANRPIRIWVPGCATGEEVYSLAISLLEFLDRRASKTPIKLFGTDVSEEVITRARRGRYPERIAADVGPERLHRFFVKEEGNYVICKDVRDLCVFARQDATRDPPFSNLDLISCRNVLIYLGPVLQRRVLPVFHYALRETGFLLLGSSESVGAMGELFSVEDRKRRVYRRRSGPSRIEFGAVTGEHGSTPPGLRGGRYASVGGAPDFEREADRVVLSRCAPPGVLIDETLQILQFRGDTGPFLAPAPGAPSNNLERMARDGLLPDLRAALDRARSENVTVRKDGLRIHSAGRQLDAAIDVIPIRVPLVSNRRFLVLFHDAANADDARPTARRAQPRVTDPKREGVRVAELERDLAAVHDYLRASLEERDAADEELRAANEELLSGNEELQSTNEELQTAHEELQATNEELLTLNEELQSRNEEASLLGGDLTNLLASVEIPIIMLGRDLRIRRFTPSAAKLLNLIPSDLHRSILDLRPKIDVPDMEALLVEVLDTSSVFQREVQDREGRWYSLCLRPYRARDGKVDGVVISLTDVDALKRYSQKLTEARNYAEAIVMAVSEPLLVLDQELRVTTANHAAQERLRTLPAGIRPPLSGEIAVGPWSVPGLIENLERLRDKGESFRRIEAAVEIPEIGDRTLSVTATRFGALGAEPPLILLSLEDVTTIRRIQEEERLFAERLQEVQRLKSLGMLAGGLAHDFNNVLTAILGSASLVQTQLPPDSASRHEIDSIVQAVRRAAEMCSQMLAYAGKGRFVVQRLDLSSVVEEFSTLLRASAGNKPTLRFDLDRDLPSVFGDSAQLRQIVLNLVINASEAIGDRSGTIIVRTRRTRPDPGCFATARIYPEQVQEEYVCLEVADDGCGMDAETQAHVFDPFFSSKATGRGLGLAAVLGIIRGHDGALTLDSDPGRGSKFRAFFPVVAGSADQTKQPVPKAATWRGKGTALIVDDQVVVRAVLSKILEEVGFRSFQADNGMTGVEMLRAHANEIDIVFLDLIMPKMDGGEAFHEMRKVRHDVKIVLMSGYNEREALDTAAAPSLNGFLRKPFGLNEVADMLRSVLEEDADGSNSGKDG